MEFFNRNRKGQIRVALLHLIGLLFFVGQDIAAMFALGAPPTWRGYLTFLLEIVTFYANASWVVPLAFNKTTRAQFILRLSVLAAAHFAIRNIIAYNKRGEEGFLAFAFSADRLILTLWRLNYSLGLSFLLGFFRTNERRKEERRQLELSVVRAEAEAARVETIMAQQQLSPHLLYNGLNYIQSYTESANVGEAVQLMADMVSYTLTDIKSLQMVSAGKELNQVQNLIRFQELLTGTRLHIALQLDDPLAFDALLPRFALITITENLLKYGELSDAGYPASVKALRRDNQFLFRTHNLKRRTVQAGNGIGLARVRHVLEYYYPQRHKMQVVEDETTYTLNLTIAL